MDNIKASKDEVGMVRVLHELGNLDGGGVARLLYDYYKHMDHEKIHFDFIIGTDIENGILEEPLKNMGCKIFKIPSPKHGLREYRKSLDKIMREGNYDIIHSHKATRGTLFLYYAKKSGIKVRIIHSHIASSEDTSLKGKLLTTVLLPMNKYLATHLFACGIDAGKYAWGEKMLNSDKICIMRNAIDIDKFSFSEEIRDNKRKELGLENKFVVGCVGRLERQKNQKFLLVAFAKLIKKRKDAILLMIGRGNDEKELKQLASELNILEYVRFLGIRKDVSDLLNVLDLFVLPSLYEGLPVVLIEAQTNGIPEIVSDKITREVNITDLISYLPICGTEDNWALGMERCKIDLAKRSEYYKQVAEAGYDIRMESLKMQNFYLKSIQQ